MSIEPSKIGTDVTNLLKIRSIDFALHTFEYLPGGGTSRSSSALGISESQVIKTLVFQTDDGKPLLVLMHGDMRVDTKALARVVGCKKIKSCSPEAAESWSGWPVGSTNPFILKNPMSIFAEESIFDLERMWINGGGRGILVSMNPVDLKSAIDFQMVRVGTK